MKEVEKSIFEDSMWQFGMCRNSSAICRRDNNDYYYKIMPSCISFDSSGEYGTQTLKQAFTLAALTSARFMRRRMKSKDEYR
jgi:hypothetical protein